MLASGGRKLRCCCYRTDSKPSTTEYQMKCSNPFFCTKQNSQHHKVLTVLWQHEAEYMALAILVLPTRTARVFYVDAIVGKTKIYV